MIEPLQDVLKKVNLKHAGIKQEPYSTPLQDQLQQLQHHKINMLFLLDSNPVALQQQLFTAIRQLHQAKAPNNTLLILLEQTGASNPRMVKLFVVAAIKLGIIPVHVGQP